MSETLEYIDNYFKNQLSPEEKRQFEQKIIDDKDFAEQVAFYCATIQSIRDEAMAEKKLNFRKIYESIGPGVEKEKKTIIRKWVPYITAAAILSCIIIGWLLLFKPADPQKLADRYIQENFQNLPVTMGTKQDSLQTGLRLYNDGKLKEAFLRFEMMLRSDTGNWEAKKYAGIVSIRLQNYDQAITYFRQLETQTGLHSNPGAFYHAITLLKRGAPGDTATAKALLQEVVQNNLAEKEAAQQILRSL